ncbi:methyltransferase [Candidatus Woesearchaeota archaeon]|nr:methyltransferase [Candidatus Woesearchaeota archaeon]
MYEPREDSILLEKQVSKLALGRVLDLGTGSGIQALTLIKSPYVREVVAADISKGAIEKLNEQIKKQRLRKIKVLHSDLFEQVRGQFNTIIFNPPYLPQDKNIQDEAIYGGKKGWEISGRFFRQASRYLFPEGKIIFLFSSLTNKDKINEIIAHNLFEHQELDKQKLPFEELYVYEIKKTLLLRELEGKGLENVRYFSRGKRGLIYKAAFDQNKMIKSHLAQKKIIAVAVKVKNEQSAAEGTVENEVKWLKLLNKYHLGPFFLFSGKNYFVCQFIEGEFIMKWIEKNTKDKIILLLKNILQQCYVLDTFKVTKEEMHHPQKHIIIDSNNTPVFLDFERCTETPKPKNVTQFLEFLCRIKEILKKKAILIAPQEIRNIAKAYKLNYDKRLLNEIFDKK